MALPRRIKPRLRSVFVWHRYMGLTVALFALMLVITGWLINHTEVLRLDSRYVQTDLILDWYGIEAPDEVLSFAVDGHWISQLGDRLYIDGKPLSGHYTRLVGAVSFAGLLTIASEGQLLLLTEEGRIVERLGDAAGVPSGMQAIALGPDDTLLIQAAHGQYRTDSALLTWRKSSIPTPDWVQPSPAPAEYRDQLVEAYRVTILPWERVLLDLHSGRIFGWWGPWIIDFAGLLILTLAITGSWIWWKYRR